MRIGIAELMWNNQQRFSVSELERLLKGTIEIEPLGEVYKKIKILPPIPIKSRQLYRFKGDPLEQWEETPQFTRDIQELMERSESLPYIYKGRGEEVRKKHNVDALVLVITGDPQLSLMGSVLEYGDYGKGVVWIGNPFPAVIAHELGHLFRLDHHHEDGTRERDIMHVHASRLRQVNRFCLRNQEKIRRRASFSWRVQRAIKKFFS